MTDVPASENNVHVEEVIAQQPIEEIPVRTPEEIKKTAKDALDFIKETASEFLTPEFWGEVQSLVEMERGPIAKPKKKQAKSTEPPIEPMTEEKAKRFGEELIPYGGYVGSKVKTVLVKDREHLTLLATKPHLFQKSLLRYLLFVDKQSKKAKKPRKTKPKTIKKKK